MRAILVPPMRLNGLNRVLTDPLRTYSGLAARQMEQTTTNFRVVAPRFQSAYDFDEGWAFTGPTDAPDGKIWFYLDKGTSVRYATMSPDYRSGTSPGTLATSPAQGGVAFVNTASPNPGIEARGWSDLIATDLGPKFQKEVSRKIRNFVFRIYG